MTLVFQLDGLSWSVPLLAWSALRDVVTRELERMGVVRFDLELESDMRTGVFFHNGKRIGRLEVQR